MDNLSIHELRDHAIRRFAKKIQGKGIPKFGAVKQHKYSIATDIASNISRMRLFELGSEHKFLSNDWISKPTEEKVYDNLVEYLESQIQGFVNDLILGRTTIYVRVGINGIRIDSLVDPSIKRSQSQTVAPSSEPYA